MRILALDPATRCGWAYANTLTSGQPALYGEWDLGVSGSEHAGNKLARLETRIETQITTLGVDKLAIEDASFGSINAATAAFHNMLRGVILLVAARHAVPFVLYKPATIKKFATGHGHAKKPQMILAAKTLLGVETTSDNIADALFILELAKQENTALREAAADKKPVKRRTSPQGKLW